MQLSYWAKKWNITDEAIKDLQELLGVTTMINSHEGNSEAGVLSRIKLEASEKGCRLWRNNVGATYTKDSSFIRYGLANESRSVNKRLKSADLIGIRPVKITREMTGITIGQFMSREIKHSDWVYSGTEREEAQLRWAKLIISLGGDACFATNEGTI